MNISEQSNHKKIFRFLFNKSKNKEGKERSPYFIDLTKKKYQGSLYFYSMMNTKDCINNGI